MRSSSSNHDSSEPCDVDVTRKEKVPDRTRARRDYLLAKAAIIGKVLGNDFWTAVSVLGTIVCGLGTIYLLGYAISRPAWLLAGAIGAVLTWWSARMAARYYRFLVEARRELAELPVVPPVRAQVAQLPAEEVLLRGSEAAAAQQGELLRAADKGSDTPKDDLLRASDNRTQ